MNQRTEKLLPGATNIRIVKSNDEQTELNYTAPPWGEHKICIAIIPGRWEIQHINRHLVTLVNHNQIIKENDTNI